MGAWSEARKKIGVLDISGKNPFWDINGEKLQNLPFGELCQICYDEATPQEVIKALVYHKDASVRQAVRSRPSVLDGQMLNPFKVPREAHEV